MPPYTVLFLVELAILPKKLIAHIVASWTGVPVQKLTGLESQKLMHMWDNFHQRLIGQEDAVKAVSRAIRLARMGPKNINRPIASFIFSGPTGVGKTELKKEDFRGLLLRFRGSHGLPEYVGIYGAPYRF